MQKIQLGILCGGKSAEHEISLLSAKNIIEALDKNKYDIHIIGIDKNGAWHLRDSAHYLLNAENPKSIRFNEVKKNLALIARDQGKQIVECSDNSLNRHLKLDVIFPVLHGTYGEDGTIQGLLKLTQVPFVGAGVLGSAICMDKDVMKRLLNQAGLPVGKFLTVHRHQKDMLTFEEVTHKIGFPFFVKPANQGSSIGISKVRSSEEFFTACDTAFAYDHKIIIEEYIQGREIECSVLGNQFPIASLPGELIISHEFYSYEAKYIDPKGAQLQIPAQLPEEVKLRIQKMAIEAFHVLCCEGMARVDFFLKSTGELFINELNTIPGFTNISMYPQLWQASGISYSELLDRLIQLAIERFQPT